MPLTSLIAQFKKWNDWAGSAFQMDKISFFCFPNTDVSLEPFEVTTGNSKASYKFTESPSPIALKNILGCFWKLKIWKKMKRFKKEEMQILELGTRFQMLHLISIEDVRAWLCLFFFFFLAVVKM